MIEYATNEKVLKRIETAKDLWLTVKRFLPIMEKENKGNLILKKVHQRQEKQRKMKSNQFEILSK